MVERQLSKLNVAGSIPVSRSMEKEKPTRSVFTFTGTDPIVVAIQDSKHVPHFYFHTKKSTTPSCPHPDCVVREVHEE